MRILIILLLCVFTLLFSKNKNYYKQKSNYKNQITVNFSGIDRDIISLDWDASSIDFTTVNMNTLDLGYLELQNAVVINELSSNSPVKITATHNGWSALPANYSGNKSNTTGDIQLFVDNLSSLSTYSGTNYASAYTEITNSGEHIIQSNGSVSGATGDINARILFDWLTDIPGTYTASLTLTVTNQ